MRWCPPSPRPKRRGGGRQLHLLALAQPRAPRDGHVRGDDEAKTIARAQELAKAGGSTGNLIYSSTKRAISRWLRREAPKPQWAGAGIPLNAVGPGTVLTPMVTELLATEESRAMVDQYVPMPLNYHLTPENVAYLLTG